MVQLAILIIWLSITYVVFAYGVRVPHSCVYLSCRLYNWFWWRCFARLLRAVRILFKGFFLSFPLRKHIRVDLSVLHSIFLLLSPHNYFHSPVSWISVHYYTRITTFLGFCAKSCFVLPGDVRRIPWSKFSTLGSSHNLLLHIKCSRSLLDLFPAFLIFCLIKFFTTKYFNCDMT